MPGRNVNNKGRRITGTFSALPHAVQDSDAYRSLSPSAVKLLMDILRDYNQKNNGDLAATFSRMKPRGWRSTATLDRAKKELLKAGLIELTRQGGLAQGRKVPNLYGLTWQPIDECRDGDGRHKLDVPPSKIPSSRWKRS